MTGVLFCILLRGPENHFEPEHMTGVLLPADLPVPIEVMVGKHLLFSVGLIVRNGLIVRRSIHKLIRSSLTFIFP